MVRGRSASWSSSGMGVACEGEERMGRLDSDILGFAKPDGFETLEVALTCRRCLCWRGGW